MIENLDVAIWAFVISMVVIGTAVGIRFGFFQWISDHIWFYFIVKWDDDLGNRIHKRGLKKKRRIYISERLLLGYPKAAVSYAEDVIQGRFPNAETSIILGGPETTYRYAKNIIKGRWFNGEVMILRSPKYSYLYARDIVRGRFKIAESTIPLDAFWAGEYENLTGISLNPYRFEDIKKE